MKILKIFLVFFLYAPLIKPLIAQWQQNNNPFDEHSVYCFALNQNNLIVGGYNAVFISTNTGQSWAPYSNGLIGNGVQALAFNNTYTFCSSDSGVFRFSNNTNYWTRIKKGLKVLDVNTIAIKDSNLIAGTFNGIYLSNNNGETWDFKNGLKDYTIISLVYNGSNLYAGTNGGAFLSKDNGYSWKSLNNGIIVASVGDFAFYEQNIFFASGAGIFVSKNNGENWSQISVMSTNVLCFHGKNLFAGTDDGVFLSTNLGLSWIQVNSGLRPKYIYALIVIDDKIIFAGTDKGIWKRQLDEMIKSGENDTLSSPTNFCLYQNYPNPFNQTTKVNYSIPQSSYVTIKVYDVLGKEVATIVDENKLAGNYSVEFNAIKLVSGIYMYRFTAGNYSQTKKFILMK
jgi:photosystem II stability/assembly factor-like uncharacterized protein